MHCILSLQLANTSVDGNLSILKTSTPLLSRVLSNSYPRNAITSSVETECRKHYYPLFPPSDISHVIVLLRQKLHSDNPIPERQFLKVLELGWWMVE